MLKSLKNTIIKKTSRFYFDLIILWDWEYDDDFVKSLLQAAQKKRLKADSFGPDEVEAFAKAFLHKNFRCNLIIDRASDVHPGLALLLTNLKSQGTILINDPKAMVWCRDKATMHLELLNQGVSVPYGIIISTDDHPESMHVMALNKLGSPYVIKPAEGGGGEGVILHGESTHDITAALQASHTGKIILQEKVIPKMIGDHRGWLRIFYILAKIMPCWWDDQTHLYHEIHPGELPQEILDKIFGIVNTIARTSHMQFFTTEVAIDHNGNLLVVDFVNEMCDMRIQSHHYDGIPDNVFNQIIQAIIEFCIHPGKRN